MNNIYLSRPVAHINYSIKLKLGCREVFCTVSLFLLTFKAHCVYHIKLRKCYNTWENALSTPMIHLPTNMNPNTCAEKNNIGVHINEYRIMYIGVHKRIYIHTTHKMYHIHMLGKWTELW